MRHFYRHRSSHRHIVENNNSSGGHPVAVMDWSSGIIYGKFSPVAPTENAIWRESNGLVFLDCRSQRALTKCARGAVEDYKYVFDWLTRGFRRSPSCNLLRNRIHVRNFAVIVRTKNRVSNRVERYLSTFLFDE